MNIPQTTKSKVVLGLIKRYPNLFSKKAVKTMVTDPSHAIFSYEDGAEAINTAADDAPVNMDETNTEPSGAEKREIKKDAADLHITDLFPNAKLEAELAIAADIERNMFDEFSDAWEKLNGITQKIDDQFGDKLGMLLDELIVVDPQSKPAIEKIRNSKVTLTEIDSSAW